MTEVAFLIIVLCAYIFPIMIILNSKRSQGHEKNGWLVGAIFFSWIALIHCAQARARQEKVKNEYLLLPILIVSVYAQQVGRLALAVEPLLIV